MPSPVHLTDGRVSIVVATAGGCAQVVHRGTALDAADVDSVPRVLHRLLDLPRGAHPHGEIGSCASGGGRTDCSDAPA